MEICYTTGNYLTGKLLTNLPMFVIKLHYIVLILYVCIAHLSSCEQFCDELAMAGL